MMNRLQSNILFLLKEFDIICKNNGIHYTLHGGTLLGAIREKGFISWDDEKPTPLSYLISLEVEN